MFSGEKITFWLYPDVLSEGFYAQHQVPLFALLAVPRFYFYSIVNLQFLRRILAVFLYPVFVTVVCCGREDSLFYSS